MHQLDKIYYQKPAQIIMFKAIFLVKKLFTDKKNNNKKYIRHSKTNHIPLRSKS